MALSINHATKVISIPKADTTFVSTNATTGYEVRSYDEYALMRELADYLDSEAGMGLPNAFTHATQVTISGVVYARSLLFLAPYTITFEAGSYQVNLIGGTNNNMLDVLNPNSVSVIAANSAGLQTVATGGGPSAGDIAAATGARIVEAGYTHDELLRLLVSHAAGSATGLEGATPRFKSMDGTKTRIDGTYAAGERGITNLDASN